MSTAFSKSRLTRLREVMADHVATGRVPGVVAMVSRRGESHVEAVGALALGGPAMARDTIFRIASMTKPVAAVAALILVEECRLRLDEPVDRWLPELRERRVLRRLDGPVEDTVPAERPITLRDLLTFRTGFGLVMAPPGTYPIQGAMAAQGLRMGPPRPQGEPAPDEWMRRLTPLPLVHQPGAQWMYDTAFDALGVSIARAAGQPLETFLRERIFEPLGMTDTGFSVPAAKLPRFAASYATDPATGGLALYDPPAGGEWSRSPAFPSGAGGLVSTADDYLAFGRMLLDGGRHTGGRILSRPSVAAMTTDQLTAEQKARSVFVPGFWDDRGWGFGVSINTRRTGLASPGRFGWDGGLGTSWASDPAEDLVGVLLTQRLWDSPVPPTVYVDFWTLAYQAIDD
jgi:CubicO group peptidase (beta-lactamase class C family)